MNGLVVYKSKYGSAKQYAHWIAEGLGIDCVNVDLVTEKMLGNYEYFVVGGSIYMGKMKISEWLTNHWEFLKHKKVYFFSVGDMLASETVKVQSVWSLNFSPQMLVAIQCRHLSGRSCFRELSWVDKLLVFVAAMRSKDKKIRAKMLGESDHMSKESALSYVAEIKSAIETASAV